MNKKKHRVWTALGEDPATTLHDVRYGEHYKGIFNFIFTLFMFFFSNFGNYKN